jgi:hypothetical protein
MAKTYEGKSRLVNLAYQVLNEIDIVVSGKTDSELMAALVSAFYRRAAEIAVAERSQRKPRGKSELPDALRYREDLAALN